MVFDISQTYSHKQTINKKYQTIFNEIDTNLITTTVLVSIVINASYNSLFAIIQEDIVNNTIRPIIINKRRFFMEQRFKYKIGQRDNTEKKTYKS